MKVAFCLYGLSGGSNSERYGSTKKHCNSFQIMQDSFESYNKNIFNANYDCSFDIYFHTRNHHDIEKIKNLYKPKKYLIDEKPTHCPSNSVIQIWSQLDSRLKVLNLVEEEYDIVFLCRFDLIFLKPLLIKEQNIKKSTVCLPTSYIKFYNGKQLEQKYLWNIPENVKNKIEIRYLQDTYSNDWWLLFSYQDLNNLKDLTIKHLEAGSKLKGVHFFPGEYFKENSITVVRSNLSFYDTPYARIKYGIYT